MGLPPAPRVGNPRVGGRPTCLAGQVSPLAAAPLSRWAPGRRPPSQGAYIKGGGRAATQQPWAPPSSPATPLPLAEARRSPAETRYIHHHAVVLLDLHQPLLPLAGSRRRRRCCSIRVLNAEVPSVRHSVIGDLDHGEYDSINHVHWNASARDLQGYVDALLSPRC